MNEALQLSLRHARGGAASLSSNREIAQCGETCVLPAAMGEAAACECLMLLATLW